MESLGIHVRDTRQLLIGGVSGLCLDGETAMIGIPVRNISCYLGTSLSVEYIGSSLTAPSFYSILDGISKVSKGQLLQTGLSQLCAFCSPDRRKESANLCYRDLSTVTVESDLFELLFCGSIAHLDPPMEKKKPMNPQ